MFNVRKTIGLLAVGQEGQSRQRYAGRFDTGITIPVL